MRSVCLGASLQNLYRFLRYNTVGVNYVGDEGIHVTKCLWRLYHNYLSPYYRQILSQ